MTRDVDAVLKQVRGKAVPQRLAQSQAETMRQVGIALATGNRAMLPTAAFDGLPSLPAALSGWFLPIHDAAAASPDAVLFQVDAATLHSMTGQLAGRCGQIVAIHVPGTDGDCP